MASSSSCSRPVLGSSGAHDDPTKADMDLDPGERQRPVPMDATDDDLPEGISVVFNPETGGARIRKVVSTNGLPPSTTRMLRSEGDLLRDLNHPNIVRLHSSSVSCPAGGTGTAEEEEGPLVLELEYLLGGDCSRLLQRHGSLPEYTVAALTRQLLHALSHCHSRGIVHRDVNLGNVVLLTQRGRPRCKLVDFGFAGRLPETGFLLEVVGKVAYMAPEMLVRRPRYDSKVDVWSAGAFAFELLTGRPPFGHLEEYGGADPEARLRRRVREYAGSENQQAELSALLASRDMSAPCRDFLLQVLQADPARRPTAAVAAAHSWLLLADAVTPHRNFFLRSH